MDCNIRSYLLGCTISTYAHHNAHDSCLCSLLLPGASQLSAMDLLCFVYWFSLPCWFQTICLFLCVSYSPFHTPRWVNMLIKRKKSFSVSIVPSARTLIQLTVHHQRSVPPALSPYINHGLPYPIFAHRNKALHSLNTSRRDSHWCLKHHVSNLKMKREKFWKVPR